MSVAETIIALTRLWLYAGAAVAALFLTIGIDRIDPDSRGAYIFRPLLIPGVLLIWPLVVWRWWVLERGRNSWVRRHRPPRGAHFKVALALAVLIPASLITGVAIRQPQPAATGAVQLTAPGAEE